MRSWLLPLADSYTVRNAMGAHLVRSWLRDHAGAMVFRGGSPPRFLCLVFGFVLLLGLKIWVFPSVAVIRYHRRMSLRISKNVIRHIFCIIL